jgi:hypothetical protein
MEQPTFDELVDKFKDNNYIEIGYITGIKRFYIKGVR